MSEADSARKRDGESGHSRHHRERIGNYVVGAEIGRGSFATVYKGHRSVSEPLASGTSCCPVLTIVEVTRTRRDQGSVSPEAH